MRSAIVAAAILSFTAPANAYILDFAQSPGYLTDCCEPPVTIDGFELTINVWYAAYVDGATAENPQGSIGLVGLNDGGAAQFHIYAPKLYRLTSFEIEDIGSNIELIFGSQTYTAPGVYRVSFDPSRSFTFDAFPPIDYLDASSLTLSNITFQAVPEPGTWAMMICGFGLVGGAMRLRARSKVCTN